MNIATHQSFFRVKVTNPVYQTVKEFNMMWSEWFEQWCIYYTGEDQRIAGKIFDGDWHRIEVIEQIN